MVAIIISVCGSIISGMILYFLQRYFKRRDKQDQSAEERRAHKDALTLKSLKAIGALTVANAVALRDGKTNGETAKALEEFEEVDKELLDFLIQNTANK